MTKQRISVKNLPEMAIAVKCVDCIHFDIQALPEYKKPCKDVGVKAYNRGCDKHNPNAARLARSLGALEAVMDAVSGMDESELRLFVMAAYKGAAIEKGTNKKFKFGTKVYFNLSAPVAEYIDSYYSGVVIGYLNGDETSPDGYLHIAASLSNTAGTSITLPISSVLTQSKWNVTFRKLLAANRFQTPSSKRLRFECGKETSPDDYEVPTLDMSIDEVNKLNAAPNKKGKKSSLETLRETAFDNEEDSDIEESMEFESKPKSSIRKLKGKAGTTVISY